MRRSFPLILPGLLAFSTAASVAGDDALLRQQLLEKVFGDAVRLDPGTHKRVLEGKAGERHYTDRDGDGKPEQVWFLDNAKRHPQRFQPLLVCAIDEDSDLRMGQEPDLDSDLYVADWKGDGSVDVVLDYTDVDGDQDLDEMGMFFYGGKPEYLDRKPVLRVWWGRDVGDDNLLWHDVGYSYNQLLCQGRTHFGGDELFVAFAITLDGNEWIPFFENPFLFYDHDQDGVTEEVLRVSGLGNEVECIRYSFDADNDATLKDPRDFDVSLSAWAPGAGWTPEGRGRGHSLLRFDENAAERGTIRGIPTGPFVRYETAPALVRPVVWERMMLTWDEIDHNVAYGREGDTEERWEGIIASGNDDFPQIGGPGSGPFNKRYELVLEPTRAAGLYYHPTDARLHLLDADRAWRDVDFNLDEKLDMRYELRDSDADGMVDSWSLDVDGDGQSDEEWSAGAVEPVVLPYDWASVHHWVRTTLPVAAQSAYRLRGVLEAALKKAEPDGAPDPLATLIQKGFKSASIDREVAAKLRGSLEARRFFDEALADRLAYRLRQRHQERALWDAYDDARSRGETALRAALVARAFGVEPPPARRWEETGAKRVDWAQDWVPPNIGWESERIGYRAYWGQFDFFGKKQERLILSALAQSPSYHTELDWGIDALLVGKSCGAGGVTLYVNDQAYPVRNPAGDGDLVFEKRLVEQTEELVTIEILARGVGSKTHPYSVRLRCSALAGRFDSPIEALVRGGLPGDQLALGIGLMKIPQEELLVDTSAGVLGTWGVQTPVIGQIGMGIVYPSGRLVRVRDLADEHQVVLRVESGVAVKYHLQCDWLRGHRFDRSPSAADWLDTLRKTAAEVRRK